MSPPNGKTLVTGAAGFIGSHLCDALLAAGEQVVGVDDFNPYYDPRLKRDNVAEIVANPDSDSLRVTSRQCPRPSSTL